ncbi:UNVERIFIED_CONTAM: hypothetical protein FKN15_074438 [Acipenser sinensis]
MSIQSFEVYSREPLPVPVIVCNGGTGRDGSVQRLSATSQRQTTYKEMHEENDADEEVDEEAEGEVVCYIHYDEMEQAPGPAAQSASFQSHSSDSCSIHTCRSRAPTSSSYQSVEDLKAMLQVPPQAFGTEYNDTASQTTENTARPEVQHILERYRTEHKESGHNIAGLDRSSNFNSNATMKLEKFFNGKLKAASHSQDPANSCDNETGLYENVDEAFEDESAPCPPAAHSSRSHKQKTSHCFSVSPNNLAHSPSLERIRMMMDKTHHVQHLQAQFEKQIQTSKRQQEREKRIWSREKVKQMTLSSRPKGTRVKDKSKAKAKGKRSDERISCQEQVIPTAWTTEVQGRRKVQKSERLELPVDDQHERRNARTGPQTSQKTALLHSQGMKSPGLEMSGLMQKHMEFCKACNLAEHLDSCSSKWCIGDRHQQRAEKGMRSMKRRSKKDLEVQRWIEKCASEDSRRSRSSNKYTDCHKGLKQACACDPCHTLDKKRGRSREAPRKSYQNLRESQEYGHQHYERPKASRSWINVIPQAERDSQYREKGVKGSYHVVIRRLRLGVKGSYVVIRRLRLGVKGSYVVIRRLRLGVKGSYVVIRRLRLGVKGSYVVIRRLRLGVKGSYVVIRRLRLGVKGSYVVIRRLRLGVKGSYVVIRRLRLGVKGSYVVIRRLRLGVKGSYVVIRRLRLGVKGSYVVIRRLRLGVKGSYVVIRRLRLGVKGSYVVIRRLCLGVKGFYHVVIC